MNPKRTVINVSTGVVSILEWTDQECLELQATAQRIAAEARPPAVLIEDRLAAVEAKLRSLG